MKTVEQLKQEIRELRAKEGELVEEIGRRARAEALADLGFKAEEPPAVKPIRVTSTANGHEKPAVKPKTTPRKRTIPEEITQWVADKSARRLPLFVMKATGLQTKKQIVARFGEDAVFEVGKPLPDERPVAQA